MTQTDGSNPLAAGAKAVAVFYVLFALVVMTYTNCAGFPKTSDRAAAPAPAPAPATPATDTVAGVAYVNSLLFIYDEAIAKPGIGWIANDRVFPTVFLDNVENFQLGALEGLRYGVRVLRDDLTRLRTTDDIDPDVEKAFNQFSLDPTKWFFPMAESEYEAGAEALRRYRARLLDGQASFHPRADNLANLISQLNSLLGGRNNRLLNCIPDLRNRRSEETAGDPNLSGEQVVQTAVKWRKIDDRFYDARGVAFAYREIMAAVLVDFEEVLTTWKAHEAAESIVVDFLDHAQFEPLYVANGRLGAMWPNHPYQLLGLLSQSRERSRSLESMITPGSSSG